MTSECIEWTGAVGTHGYGRMPNDELVHRAAWRGANGEIPDGMLVLHRCDNRLCYNPKHLFLGTTTDNMRDMVAKGRHKTQRKLNRLQAAGIASDSRVNRIIANEYGVSTSLVGAIKRKEIWQ